MLKTYAWDFWTDSSSESNRWVRDWSSSYFLQKNISSSLEGSNASLRLTKQVVNCDRLLKTIFWARVFEIVGCFLGTGVLSFEPVIDYILPINQPPATVANGTSFFASSCCLDSICLIASWNLKLIILETQICHISEFCQRGCYSISEDKKTFLLPWK